jgi:hypothetical protein
VKCQNILLRSFSFLEEAAHLVLQLDSCNSNSKRGTLTKSILNKEIGCSELLNFPVLRVQSPCKQCLTPSTEIQLVLEEIEISGVLIESQSLPARMITM